MENEELDAQMEAFKAEGLLSQKVRLEALRAKQKLVMNEDYLGFITAYRDVQKVIKTDYLNNPRVVDALSTFKQAGENLDAVKAKECPATYQYEQKIREIKRAVVSLLAKGEVKEACGVKVESVAIGVKLLLNANVAVMTATA